MANIPAVIFGCLFQNDGVSTTITIDLSTDPCFILDNSNWFPLGGNLDLSIAVGITAITCDSGVASTSAVLLAGVLTITFASSPGVAGTFNTVYGNLLF